MTSYSATDASNCADAIEQGVQGIADNLLCREMNTKTFTRALTKGLCTLIADRMGKARTEYKLDITRTLKSGKEYSGYIDIFANFPDNSKLAIEIDRGNKLWSLEKLAFSADVLQAQAIWIRWRGEIKVQSIGAVRFIDLTLIGNHVQRICAARTRVRQAI
jgi:hypothetical protein